MKKSLQAVQRGFTLVELMISLVIGMLIVLALVALLININRNNTELSKSSRVIENGRFALQLLEADVAHAGFWDGFVPKFDDLLNKETPTPATTDVPAAIPDPCVPFASWGVAPHTDPTTVPPMSHKNNLIGIPVQAYEIPAVVPSPALSVCATTPTNFVTNPQPNTDVLVVRYVETCVPSIGNCPPLVVGDVYFQAARCGEPIPSPAYALNAYTVANFAVDFPFKKRFTVPQASCTNASTAELRKFVSNLYYIRNYAVTAGDGIPTLMRAQFNGTSFGTAQPLIEGVQGFRVEFGIDNLSDTGAAVNFTQGISWANPANLTSPTNRGDGLPDGSYIRCTTGSPCTAAQLMNAVAVRIHVLIRSENTTPGYTDSKTYSLGGTTLGPFNDSYKRHVFTQTIRLTNVSMRRETP